MKICFVADDYGESQETNEAIAHVCAGSIVRSVAVVGSESSVYSDIYLKRERDIAWGIHLYLTDYIPLTAKLKGLYEDGRRLIKRDIISGVMTGRISSSHIYQEFDAQISRLCEFGPEPQFIGTHQNLHGLPLIFGIVRQVANKYGLENNIRPSCQLYFSLKKNVRTVLSNIYSTVVRFRQRSRVLVGCPGYGKETIKIEGALEAWDYFLSKVKAKRYNEIIVPCHPGLSPSEVELYLSARFLELFDEHGISLAKGI
jgi:predicted glycoside hydrolase/deacetylase ChbG (UPF0249 family)